MIRELVIKNFKGILNADIKFNKDRNVIVGNNGVGKSTIIEALSLVLGYGLNQLEIVPSLFNIRSALQFVDDKIPPEIIIEVYFNDDDTTTHAEFSGKNNTKHEYACGIQLKISFDSDIYGDLYEAEIAENPQIPCEYYKIERNWFSDNPVIQRQIPYYAMVIDSSSNYFQSSSNQYIVNLLQRYVGDKETIKIKSGLRRLKQSFEQDGDLRSINEDIARKRRELSLSIDVSSNIITRNIICPYFNHIPVSQIGAGDLCILKTLLSLDKTHLTDKPKIVIIEEPESHLSHTKMYELINGLNDSINGQDTQVIITTHNNFIANKLNLDKLLLITNEQGNIKATGFSGNEYLTSFFTKVSNYPTLRLILSNAAILVEGPADEMVVTYYYQKRYKCHPFEHGIELISVDGVKFKAFVELAIITQKKVAVITDNDYMESIDEILNERGLDELPDFIKVFTDANPNNHTLEPSFVNANVDNLQELSDTIRKRHHESDNESDLVKYMIGHKTDWAFRLLQKVDEVDFNVPTYIVDAVRWIDGRD